MTASVTDAPGSAALAGALTGPGSDLDTPGTPRTWHLGRVFVLRHAGFPFDWVEELGGPVELLQAAETLLDAEDALLGCLAGSGQAAQRLRADVHALRVDAVPTQPRPGVLPAARAGWAARHARWVDAVTAYLEAFAAADAAADAVLRAVLRRPRLQEAVFGSNPSVYRNMLVPFVAGTGPLTSRWRRARRQLYTYVQRLCAKNETVSFFGPMAYGHVVPDDAVPDSGVRLHTDLPRRRKVFLSYWAALEVAAAVGRDAQLRPVLPLRRTGVRLRPGVPGWLDEARWAEVLGPDGANLTAVAAATGVPLREATTRVVPLVGCAYLEFGLAPAPDELEPLPPMVSALRAVPGPAAAAWADRLDALQGLIEEVERSPFPARIHAVARLEAAFSEITGTSARRGAGAVYADRAVYYEECSSPFALQVGERVAARWAQQVTAALEVSVAHGAHSQQQAAEQVVAVLRADGANTGEISLSRYGELLQAGFAPRRRRFEPPHAAVRGAADWRAEVAALLRHAADLRGDRYAVVDLCPQAAAVEHLGSSRLVLSRCHHHLLTEGWLGTMHRPDGGTEAFGADAAGWAARHPGVVALDVGRRNKGWYRFPGRRVALRRPCAADVGDPRLLRPDDVRVRYGSPAPGPALECFDPAGRRIALYLPLSDLVKYPPFAALSHPQVLHATFRGGSGSPEVVVGGALYQRPRRVLDTAALAEASAAAWFLLMRRTARWHPGERFLFARTERERKPYLLDLASVLAADLLAHVASGGVQVLAEPMRPGPTQLWLRDAQGRRYTSELRVQVVGRDVATASGPVTTAGTDHVVSAPAPVLPAATSPERSSDVHLYSL
ncbi:MAG TPA: hypothetical protein VI248_25080 [Kineosporiaceae bacterium]